MKWINDRLKWAIAREAFYWQISISSRSLLFKTERTFVGALPGKIVRNLEFPFKTRTKTPQSWTLCDNLNKTLSVCQALPRSLFSELNAQSDEIGPHLINEFRPFKESNHFRATLAVRHN